MVQSLMLSLHLNHQEKIQLLQEKILFIRLQKLNPLKASLLIMKGLYLAVLNMTGELVLISPRNTKHGAQMDIRKSFISLEPNILLMRT